jgi:O-antigen/teichoic acid export membrane protein
LVNEYLNYYSNGNSQGGMMSLKADIAANYASQIYVMAVSIAVVPLYIRYMGSEAYGLIGFFTVLQACFQVLDLGLTATMVRETSQFRGGAIDATSLRSLLRALEYIFVCVAITGASALCLYSGFFAHSWLKVEELPLSEVQHAIVFMAVIAALRWISGLYRGVISGFQKLVWLSGINSATATVRFLLAVPVLIYIGAQPTTFFAYQLLVALAEVLVLWSHTYRLLPQVNVAERTRFHVLPLKRVLRFSLSMAFVGVTWVMVTQADKLILSRMLPLGEYAQYTIAVMLSNGIIFAGAPVVAAILPRLNKLSAQQDDVRLYRLYRDSTQVVAAITIPIAAVLATFAQQVLWIWTGNADLARQGMPVLALYSLGTGLLSISAMPSHLQVAKGSLRLYVSGAAIYITLLIPILIFGTSRFGAAGAAGAWFLMNLLYLLAWVPVVHRSFYAGLHRQWLGTDVTTILLSTMLASLAARYMLTWSDIRPVAVLQLTIVSAMILAAGIAGSSYMRKRIALLSYFSKFPHRQGSKTTQP